MAITFVAAGTSSATNGSAPSPGLPSGLAVNDLMLTAFFSREVTDGTVNISAGWTQVANERSAGGLMALWYRRFQTGDAAPSLFLTGHTTGNSGDSAVAQIAAWRGVADSGSPVAVTGTVSTNVSQQNIGAISGLDLVADDLVVCLGGKRDDWTSVTTLVGDVVWNEIGEPDTTSGADAGMVWNYAITAVPVTVASKTFTVVGGAAATGKGVMVSVTAEPAAVVSWWDMTLSGGTFSGLHFAVPGAQMPPPLAEFDVLTPGVTTVRYRESVRNPVDATITMGPI